MIGRIRVGLDLDGVIIDHTANKLELAKSFGYSLEPWQTNTNVMKGLMELGKYEELQEKLYAAMTLDAPPVGGSLEELPDLAQQSELYIISARRPDTVRYAQEWLMKRRLFDFIPAERIFFCNGSKDKRGICDRLSVDVFLDDKLSVLANLAGRVRKVLFDPDDVAKTLELGQGIEVVTAWDAFNNFVSGR